jgi:hypothetical protein
MRHVSARNTGEEGLEKLTFLVFEATAAEIDRLDRTLRRVFEEDILST